MSDRPTPLCDGWEANVEDIVSSGIKSVVPVALARRLERQRDAAVEALRELDRAYVRLLEIGRDRITSLGGDCDPVDVMERGDIDLRKARAVLRGIEEVKS